jgi:predicted flavoprotein YhiN
VIYDIVVVGAGAAGLTAAIFAKRAAPGARIVLLDGAPKIGAKILISGGGRCNVTHYAVEAADFNGNRNAIARVLRTFPVDQTIAWFSEMGVELKSEETGKLFPVSDRASTIVDALLRACEGVEVRTGARVVSVSIGASHEAVILNRRSAEKDLPQWSVGRASAGDPSPSTRLRMTASSAHQRRNATFPDQEVEELFAISLASGDELLARRVILATGGRSVPKTGSDGHGYQLVKALGHEVTELFPALVPLVLEPGHWMTALSGTSAEVELSVRSSSGRVLSRHRGSMLFTHFGLSGPVVLDVSRHWIAERGALVANFLPGETFESVEARMVAEARKNPRATGASVLRGRLPQRLLEALVPQSAPLGAWTKEERRRTVRALVETPVPVVRDRGFDYAEVTAGGVPLSEVDLSTMASRRTDGLYLCGEILDVDGRIGGFNFQWAWASGRLAGLHAVRSLPTR